MPFEHKLRVRFNETDPAGIVFFSNIFVYCHEAFEEMLRAVGMPLEEILKAREYALPLAHAEADFQRPFRFGVLVTVRVSAARIGERSLTLYYEMVDESGAQLATAKMVHVAVDLTTGRSVPLSPRLKAAIGKFQA